MFTVAALYKFTHFADPVQLAGALETTCRDHKICGTLILAREGINGTVAGSGAAIDALISHIQTLPGCSDIVWKESHAEAMPFGRLKVRVKSEIVTMGQPDVNPLDSVGTYVAPKDWNALIERSDVSVIDTRNDYEVAIGTFEGAEDPKTQSFREFPDWWANNSGLYRGKKIAMFCTGGIRCEKASNYLLAQGAEEVFHLQGGILKYLEEIPEEESLWNGECFVFDERVSVKHGLEEGSYNSCYACRRPISEADMSHDNFELGVTCPKCIDEYSEEDRERFRERQKQIALAARRGVPHFRRD